MKKRKLALMSAAACSIGAAVRQEKPNDIEKFIGIRKQVRQVFSSKSQS
jgi:hypothetical protein